MHGAAELIHAIASLAWPVLAIAAVFVFRSQLATLLAPSQMRRLKVGPVEAEWERQLAEAEVAVESAGVSDAGPPDLLEDLSAVAAVSPNGAVMEAYARIEAELRTKLEAADLPADVLRSGAARLARLAAERDLISPETVTAVEGIGVLRNLAAHGRTTATPEQALDYLVLADSVLFSIRNPPSR